MKWDDSGKKPLENRLTKTQSAEVERILEAEYMPFYIKDLRTNEIIGFHAFLDTFTDGFNANYSEVKGVGRIEAAPILHSRITR